MLALCAAPKNEAKIEIREVAEPSPLANEALVAVKATSLNRGEVLRAVGKSVEDGWRPGWDVAGIVERRAADGSGPPEGTRVVGLVRGGGWAERVAVPTRQLAPIPDELGFG